MATKFALRAVVQVLLVSICFDSSLFLAVRAGELDISPLRLIFNPDKRYQNIYKVLLISRSQVRALDGPPMKVGELQALRLLFLCVMLPYSCPIFVILVIF